MKIFMILNVVICIIACIVSSAVDDIEIIERILIFTTIITVLFGIISMVIPFFKFIAIIVGVINVLIFLISIFRCLFEI